MMKKEDSELIKFFDWVGWQEKIDPRFKSIYHIANERKTSWQAGKILKSKGVRAGVLDVCVPIPVRPYPGMYVELKIKPNKLSKEQSDFSQLMHAMGYAVRVAWSGDELIELVKSYIKGEF